MTGEIDDAHEALIEQQLDWVRFVERFDEATAARMLADRTRSEARRARDRLVPPEPWPSRPANVERMMRRDAEITRFDRMTELIRDGDRVLDIGCGHGVVAACIARRRTLGAYLGVDLSESNIDSAREMAAANDLADVLEFEVADAAELDRAKVESLAPTVALFLEVLEHLADPVGALRSIADNLPAETPILFSVPLLGRIEACWGHRIVFGAEAIRGLADEAGLTIQHVEELANTWALVAATRSPASNVARFRAPRPDTASVRSIAQVRVDRVEVDAPGQRFVEGPLRLVVDATPAHHGVVSFDAADSVMLRIDVELSPGAAALAIEAIDARGRTVWTHDVEPAIITDRRQTLVLRPNWPLPGVTGRAGGSDDPVQSYRIEIRALRPTELTLWRIGTVAGAAVDPISSIANAPRQSAQDRLSRLGRTLLRPPEGTSRRSIVRRATSAARSIRSRSS